MSQHLSHYNMASLGLWTLPFCSLVWISPTVAFVNLQSGLTLSDVLVALHRFPSSHAPVFLGGHLNAVGPLPPPAATNRRPLPSRCCKGHRWRGKRTHHEEMPSEESSGVKRWEAMQRYQKVGEIQARLQIYKVHSRRDSSQPAKWQSP